MFKGFVKMKTFKIATEARTYGFFKNSSTENGTVLDGDFLRLPKFVSMINGGSEEFRENGWHGMYVLSVKEINKRIYPLSMDFEIFKSHALQAAEQWLKRRQWFDSMWIAND